MRLGRIGLGALALLVWQGTASAEIKLGAVLSVTGPAAFLGEPEKRTLEMYIEKINAAGGINGEKIKLTLYDDGADANKARTFAQRLVDDDGVTAIIGSTLTGPSMAVSRVANEAKVPAISLAGGTQIIEPLTQWMFKIGHTDRMACQKNFEDMKARGLTRIGLISGTDAFGNGVRTECLAHAEKYGITIIADERHGPQDSDMTPQLAKIRAAPGLQALMHSGFGEAGTVVTRNVRQMGFDVPFYQSHGVAAPNFIRLTGAAAEGTRLPASLVLIGRQLPQDDPLRSVVVGYMDEYEKRFNEPASNFGGFAYDALQLLVLAWQKAKSTEPAKVRDALEQLGAYNGVTGVTKITAQDHLGLDLTSFRMVEVKNGTFQLLK